MENSLLVFGAVAVAAILIIVNEYLLKSSIVKSKPASNKKVQLPFGAIEYLDTTYIPVADFLAIKNNSSKRVEKNKSAKKENNRLKGTLFFIMLLSILFYFAA